MRKDIDDDDDGGGGGGSGDDGDSIGMSDHGQGQQMRSSSSSLPLRSLIDSIIDPLELKRTHLYCCVVSFTMECHCANNLRRLRARSACWIRDAANAVLRNLSEEV